jgi:hypothetical protein
MEARWHLKFIGVELAGGAERPARADVTLSSASQPHFVPRHRPLEVPWELDLDPCRGGCSPPPPSVEEGRQLAATVTIEEEERESRQNP